MLVLGEGCLESRFSILVTRTVRNGRPNLGRILMGIKCRAGRLMYTITYEGLLFFSVGQEYRMIFNFSKGSPAGFVVPCIASGLSASTVDSILGKLPACQLIYPMP